MALVPPMCVLVVLSAGAAAEAAEAAAEALARSRPSSAKTASVAPDDSATPVKG
jgi:hypothetical protein